MFSGGAIPGRVEHLETQFNAYGPLFNALAPLVWVNPLANKLLFAFSYLAYVIWLIKDLAPRQGLVTLSWPWLSLWLLNPFPWVEIAYFGYFDVLVGLACVAAVHSLISKKRWGFRNLSGDGDTIEVHADRHFALSRVQRRRLHFRLLSVCAGVVIFGLGVSSNLGNVDILAIGVSCKSDSRIGRSMMFWPQPFVASPVLGLAESLVP